MDPFPKDKAEGAKKVIVAASSSSNHVLRARTPKGSSSPRHLKSRTSKTYSGTHSVNGNLMNLSWPSLGHQVSPGNSSPEKTPLGLYRSGSSFENACPGMQLDSSKFLSDSSSVAKFNATLFSSAANQGSQDVEEAMDIDHQDVSEEAACASSSVSELSKGNVSAHDQCRTEEDKNLTEKYPAVGESHSDSSSIKPMVINVSVATCSVLGPFYMEAGCPG